MRRDNPHISKRRGGRKNSNRKFSLQAFHPRHLHGHGHGQGQGQGQASPTTTLANTNTNTNTNTNNVCLVNNAQGANITNESGSLVSSSPLRGATKKRSSLQGNPLDYSKTGALTTMTNTTTQGDLMFASKLSVPEEVDEREESEFSVSGIEQQASSTGN